MRFLVSRQVRFYRARFPGRKEGICSRSMRNVGTSSTVFSAKEITKEKWGIGRIRGEFSCN